jgi:hypothetical protein
MQRPKFEEAATMWGTGTGQRRRYGFRAMERAGWRSRGGGGPASDAASGRKLERRRSGRRRTGKRVDQAVSGTRHRSRRPAVGHRWVAGDHVRALAGGCWRRRSGRRGLARG